MTDFFKEFNKVSKEEWKAQIISDLKGKSHSVLEFYDEIEEIQFDAYYHRTDIKENNEVPGNFPYKRGINSPNNNWSNSALINITASKEANESALNLLMNGVDTLFFTSNHPDISWKEVLNDIKFEYIHARFNVKTIMEYDEICNIVGENFISKISFDFDIIENTNDELFNELAARLKKRQHGVFTVNGFGIQQIGGTTWQEVAFCLNSGHEIILKLLEAGLEIDKAAACINFNIGIGSNYFFETAKLRALRQLWAKIITEYNPKHNCSHYCMITAIVGHTNKSLKDPFTNLLRQTTEAMSAINGGIDNILVLPYDLYSKDGASVIATRMAINISLILKEESYFDKVIDPIGGSYSIEKLTELIGEKSYSLFQKLESDGGLLNPNCKSILSNEIQLKRNLRSNLFAEGKIIGIGMNKYSNPDEKPTEWVKVPSYMNIEGLLFDQISKTVEA